ncbi:MAG: acyl-[acyl-carrier-protein] thioesterase [Candidatus Coproplasma sp.]
MYCNKNSYSLRYTDVDFNDNLKLSSLLSLMEESACLSADELGFGYSVLQPKNIGFILVNWSLKLSRAIKLGEVLTIHTWPIKPKKLIVFRDFELYVGEEKVGVATSRWCLVNLADFSMLSSDAVFSKDMTYNECRSMEVSNWKIPSVESDKLAYSKTASYSDYDHYNHVNNTKYADILFDVFSVDEMRGKYFSDLQITYVKQCKCGERIDLYKCDTENGILVEGRVGREVRVQMRVVLNEG